MFARIENRSIEENDVSANVWPAPEHGKEANKVGLSRMSERTRIKRSIFQIDSIITTSEDE